MKKYLFLAVVPLALISCDRNDRPSNPPIGNSPSSTTMSTSVSNPSSPNGSSAEYPEYDNTRMNVRERSDDVKTPLDQSENEADRTLTQKIRQSLVEDSALSTNAQNIKIVTVNGVVTLRGPVNSVFEKNLIEKKVQGISGINQVDNQLDVIIGK